MDPVTLTVLGAAVGILGTQMVGRVHQVLARRQLHQRLLEHARRLRPSPFVPPSCTWRYAGRSESISTHEELSRSWGGFLQGQERLLVVTGTFGMGKTSLIRYLLSTSVPGVRKRLMPVYVECQHISSRAILQEVTRLINESLRSELGVKFVADLLRDPDGLIVFDALDQMSYRAGESNYVDAILDLVEQEKQNPTGAHIVIVMRREFVDFVQRLGTLVDDAAGSRVEAHGFLSDEQLHAALRAHAHAGPTHWSHLTELVKDPSLRTLFSRPMTLDRYATIDAEDLERMESTGTTIGRIFSLSFKRLLEEERIDLERLAWEMFSNHRHDVHLRSLQLAGDVPDVGRVRGLAARTGVVSVDHYLCQFTHASFRDYFVAERFLRSVRQGELSAIGELYNTYLVSEFAAGLLDEDTLIRMLAIVSPESGIVALTNVSDILSELEQPRLIDLATTHFDSELQRTWDMPMDEYKVALYVNAGIMGFAKPIDAVISHVRSIGIGMFLRSFFATRDNFAYYGSSQDRCEDEWTNVMSRKKYRETRRLMAFLLGEMRSARALPQLKQIMTSSEEALALRKTAGEAIGKITGPSKDVQT